MSTDDKALSRTVEAVLDSSRYRHVSPTLVAEISRAELAKGRSLKEAVKAVKNKLHQVAGAYLDDGGESSGRLYGRWLAELRDVSQYDNPGALQSVCRSIMAHHASTRERLPILDDFYSAIFGQLPPISSVVDVACGLNPLAIPWMTLETAARYFAYDIYSDTMSFLGDFMALAGVSGHAETRNVIANPPTVEVDLALVLKAIPCLEQIDKSAGRRLLDGLNARHIVVSFPVASLGGRNKGMAATYEARFHELADDRPWLVTKLEFQTELAFLITTQ